MGRHGRDRQRRGRATSNMAAAGPPRCVALIDMDCFYCAVERALDPSLVGLPMAVVQYNPYQNAQAGGSANVGGVHVPAARCHSAAHAHNTNAVIAIDNDRGMSPGGRRHGVSQGRHLS